MKKILLIVAAFVLVQFSLSALAHHSAARFDFTNRDATITGIVKVFKVANPHTTIILEVTDDKGTRDIEFEGHSRNNYYRAGWRPDLIVEGDKITLKIAPKRDGSDGGYAFGVITKDGTEF